MLVAGGKPVYYTSRALTSTGKNYAQIENELLAVVSGMNDYIYKIQIVVESETA